MKIVKLERPSHNPNIIVNFKIYESPITFSFDVIFSFDICYNCLIFWFGSIKYEISFFLQSFFFFKNFIDGVIVVVIEF